MNKDIDKELPLSAAVFHILLSLADQERHGYGIMQEVKERTNGRVHMGPGTLYGAIKRMLKKELIEEVLHEPESPEEEKRRYYRLTRFGGLVLRAEAIRLEELVRQARIKELLPADEASGGAL